MSIGLNSVNLDVVWCVLILAKGSFSYSARRSDTVAAVHCRSYLSVIGRESEIASMKRLLSQDSHVNIVGLFGSAGSGKSCTAREVCMQLKMDHEHLKVSLIDMTECVEERLWAQHFLEKLSGAPPKKTTDSKEALGQWLRMNRRDCLLLIDNCEVGVAFPTFNRFLGSVVELGHGNVKCLLVSQRRFYVQGEGVNMQLQSWASLQSDDAARLFLYFAGSACPEEDARCICDICGNIPLTVKGAAFLVGSGRISCSDLIRSLQTEEIVHVLQFVDGDLSLTRMLQTSFNRWSIDEQKEFVRLSVFPGSFSIDLADEVLFSASDTIWRLPCIQQQPQPGEYELHRVYREFGWYLASNQSTSHVFGPVYQQARGCYLAACAQTVTFLSEKFSQDASGVKEQFALSGHHIKTFIKDAVPHGLESRYIAAALRCPFLLDTFVGAAARIAFYEHCIHAASTIGSQLDECQLRYWLAQDLISEGHVAEALPYFDEAEKIFSHMSHDQQDSLNGIRHYVSSLRLNRGDYDKESFKEPCYQSAVEAFVTLQPLTLLSNKVLPKFICGSLAIRTLVESSSVYSRVKAYGKQSVEFAQIGLQLCNLLEKPESDPDRLTCMNSLGIAQMTSGKFQDALSTFGMVLEVQRTLTGKHRDLAILLSNIGQCHAELGSYTEAREKSTESYEMLKMLYGDEHKETLRSRFELAVNCGINHDHESALEHYRRIWDAIENMDETNRKALDVRPDVVREQIADLQHLQRNAPTFVAIHTDWSYLFKK